MSYSLQLQTTRGISDLIYSYALSSLYRSPWVYNPQLSEAREPDATRLVRNQVDIASSWNRASKALIRPWRIMPFDGSRDKKDNQLAAICKDGIGNIFRFDRRRRRIGEARMMGRTYSVIFWQKRRMSLGATPEMDWYVPVRMQDVDRRRFHWVPEWNTEGTEKTGIHLEFWNTNAYRWERIPRNLRRSMVEYIYGDTEESGGYGDALMDSIYFAHYLLTVTFEKISQGIDKWANGIWIGTVDAMRQASVAKTSGSLQTAMRDVMLNLRSSGVAVIEKVDDIKVIETSGTGHQISMDFKRDLVDGIERLFNGSVRPGGGNAGGTGARAQAETEQDESESFFQEERTDLDAIIDADVVGSFISTNSMQIETLGLAKARRPKFSSEQIQRQNPEEAVRVMNEANKKVKISLRQYYEKAELEEPLEDEPVIDVQPEGQPGFGDGGGDFRDLGFGKEKSEPKKAYSYGNGNGKDKPRFGTEE